MFRNVSNPFLTGFNALTQVFPKEEFNTLLRGLNSLFHTPLQVEVPPVDTVPPLEEKRVVPIPGSTLVKPLPLYDQPFNPALIQWQINFGFLYSIYKNTDDELVKRTVHFLITNYLAKAAFLNGELRDGSSQELQAEYLEMLQLGLFQGRGYQRGLPTALPYFSEDYEDNLGTKEERSKACPNSQSDIQSFYLIGASNVEPVFKLSFTVLPGLSKRQEMIDIMMETYSNHFSEVDKFFPKPFLIDISERMGDKVFTDQDEDAIQEYVDAQETVRKELNDLIREVVLSLRKKYKLPIYKCLPLTDYLKSQMVVISISNYENEPDILNGHTCLFHKEDFYNPGWFEALNSWHSQWINKWIGSTGIGIGGIEMRYFAGALEELDSISPLALTHLPELVEYCVPGTLHSRMYRSIEDITSTNILSGSFFEIQKEGTLNGIPVGPAQRFYVSATYKMIMTLFAEIGEEKWQSMQEDPNWEQLIQIATPRLLHHLSDALLHIEDFRLFSQAIDRAHAELTTLLVIFDPFDTDTFESDYSQYVSAHFPTGVKPTVVGIGRSAMSVYSGVLAAVMDMNPDPRSQGHRIIASKSYYELAEIPVAHHMDFSKTEDYFSKPVDLYVTEFYHNLINDPTHTKYKKENVKDALGWIIANNSKKNHPVTIAIDTTIDYTQSKNVQDIVEAFQKEIHDGLLNIVIFRSGQKFDMLGLDNYFGSLYYIINNGDPKWAPFNQLKTERVFQTDPLSRQFFTWITKAGAALTDQYKKLIFTKTREILKLVPESLKTEESSLTISEFADDVLMPYFEIVIKENVEETFKEIHDTFMKIFLREKKMVYRRGSYGFMHPNISLIGSKVRITPGADENENALFGEFFEALAHLKNA